MHHVGVLAYGSLRTSPGWELEEAIDRHVEGVYTPFHIEFARKSRGRGDAPTLVPVTSGGAHVMATVLVMKEDISLSLARDMTYRRELNKVGDSTLVYLHEESPCPNKVRLPVVVDVGGVEKVIYTALGDTIPEADRNGKFLARAAVDSVGRTDCCRDGITYLRDAISVGIATPLTDEYRDEVLRLTGADDLDEAVSMARRRS